MASNERRTFSGRAGVKAARKAKHSGAKGNEYFNERRRNLYASDPDYADDQRRQAREAYRRHHPLEPSRLAGGLLSSGQNRELIADEMETPVYVESYTMPEAARALGRSEISLKKWIAEGIIPAPILRDTTKGYRHYSIGEMLVLVRTLAEHENSFTYLSTKHTETIHRIWQAMQAYRSRNV